MLESLFWYIVADFQMWGKKAKKQTPLMKHGKRNPDAELIKTEEKAEAFLQA